MIDAFVRFVGLFKYRVWGVILAVICVFVYKKYLAKVTFINPLTGAKLTSKFNEYRGAKGYHNGIDLAEKVGTPIVAASSGTIATGNNAASGNYIIITHKQGYKSSYSHLGKYTVKNGQNVSKGQQIGTVGITGATTGPHLHFTIKKDGTNIDPLPLIS